MPDPVSLILNETRRQLAASDASQWEEKERILLASCHPKQLDFVLDEGRRVAALCSRGAGKSTGGRARFIRRMLRTKGAQCLFIAMTRPQAEELMWAPLKDTIEKLGIDAEFNETKLRCTFLANGAQLRLVGADNKKEIEKLRGIPHHEVGIDEAASHDRKLLDHLLFRIIGPRLGDYGGSLWMVGTPNHVLDGYFYEVTRPGSEMSRKWADRDLPEYADWKRWSFHQWNLEDAAPHVPAIARLWKEALVEKEANGWSNDHPVWRREYLGLWAADDTDNIYRYRPYLDDGKPWNQWDPPRHLNGFAKLPDGHEWRYVYGMDMGHRDPFGLVIFAYSTTTRELFHVHEFKRKDLYPKAIAQILIGEALDHSSYGGCIGHTGWPDGMAADTAGLGGAILDELRNVHGIKIEPAEKKSKHDSIELFNGDLIDGRIKILKGSELEQQLLTLQWDVDDYGRLKENRNSPNDLADAAIYARRLAYHQFAKDSDPSPYAGIPGVDRVMAEQEDAMAYAGDVDEFGNFLGLEDFDSILG